MRSEQVQIQPKLRPHKRKFDDSDELSDFLKVCWLIGSSILLSPSLPIITSNQLITTIII